MAKLIDQLYAAKASGKKGFALLIDPDRTEPAQAARLAEAAAVAGARYLLVGGSLVRHAELSPLVRELKARTGLPVLLFPGNVVQVVPEADAILFLSLISGRNPELLIGQQVVAAPLLQRMELEVMPTGYMLVDGGKPTSASYMSATLPLPYDKPELAAYTALAGQYLGMRLMYADAGSGAERPISAEMIRAIAQTVETPLIIGGGIRTPEQAARTLTAGADVFVVGTVLEDTGAPDATLLNELGAAAHACSQVAAR